MSGGGRLGRSLPLHLVALALVLAATSAVVGTHGRYSGDEGAVVVTARTLASGRGWLTPHPVPRVDPDGHLYPLVSSAWGARGVSGYAKHPAYAALLGRAEAIWSGWGPVAASVLGTVAAAGFAAVLARRLFPGAEVVALWLVGIGSPLFVDAQLVMAHTLAAATATGAVLAADSAARSRRVSRWCWSLTVAAAVAATAAFRSEGVLFGLALAAGCVIVALRPAHPPGREQVEGGPGTVEADPGRAEGPTRLGAAMAAVAAVAGVAAAIVVDRAWLRSIVGPVVTDPSQAVPLGSGSLIGQRIDGFVLTVVRPSYGSGVGPILLVLALGLLALSLVVAGRRPPDHRAAALLIAGAGLLTLVRAVGVAPEGVPGLLVAFPLGLVGLVVAGRATVDGDRRRVVAWTAGTFAVAVAATQYAVGGGVEWGGRYFALAIPSIAPAAAFGLVALAGRMDRAERRVAVGGLIAVVLGLALLGGRELHQTGGAADAFYRDLPSATASAGDRPVVVTTDVLLPRLAGRTFDQQRWLLADRDDPDHDLVEGLRAAGVDRFVLVTDDPVADAPLVDGARRIGSTVVSGRQVAVYET